MFDIVWKATRYDFPTVYVWTVIGVLVMSEFRSVYFEADLCLPLQHYSASPTLAFHIYK